MNVCETKKKNEKPAPHTESNTHIYMKEKKRERMAS
jgi:hypothetical protein